MTDLREAKWARLTGLFQRGSSSYLRVVLPQDHPFQTKYKNVKFVQSLGFCSYREALQKIHGKWRTSKARSTDTVDTCLRAVRLYETFRDDLPIEDLTRDRGESEQPLMNQGSNRLRKYRPKKQGLAPHQRVEESKFHHLEI